MKRTKEKKSSIGIITVKTIREVPRPYIVISVRDTNMGDDITQEEAVKRGIINEEGGTYTDRRTGKKMLIKEAADLGQIKLEYTDEGEVVEPEVRAVCLLI